MIKVTFVVIGYNVSQYIEKCIKSILNQTIKDIEVIFVNDGSTDNTYELVKRLADKDNRIRIVSQENLGANSARKYGYSYANGKYVVFIDGDDWVENNLAEELYDIAEKNSYDIVSFGHYIVKNSKKVAASTGYKGEIKEYKYLDLILERNISHNLWNKFIKRDFLIKSSFQDIPGITMGDDLAANVRFGLYKPNVLSIEKCYYNYYQRESSVTKELSPKVLEIEDTIKDIESNLKQKGLSDKYKKHIEYIKFRNFYSRVVRSPHKDCEIRRQIYANWKKSKVEIRNNELCTKFLESRNILERILAYAYNRNYKLGYMISQGYLKLFRKSVQ